MKISRAVADRDAGRFLAAVLEREQAQRGDGGGLGARIRAAATTPKTPHISARPPSRARAAGPCSQARGGGRASATSSASATPRAALLGRARRARAGELDDEPVAADRCRAPRPAGRARRPGSASAAACCGRRGDDEPARALAEQVDGRRARDRQADAGADAGPRSPPRRARRRARRRTRPAPRRGARARRPR